MDSLYRPFYYITAISSDLRMLYVSDDEDFVLMPDSDISGCLPKIKWFHSKQAAEEFIEDQRDLVETLGLGRIEIQSAPANIQRYLERKQENQQLRDV